MDNFWDLLRLIHAQQRMAEGMCCDMVMRRLIHSGRYDRAEHGWLASGAYTGEVYGRLVTHAARLWCPTWVWRDGKLEYA